MLFPWCIVFVLGFIEVSPTILPLTDFLKTNAEFNQKIIESNIPFKDLEPNYKKCAKSAKSKFLDNTSFIMEQKNICKGRVSIIIGIHSNNPNYHRRQIIRETFGSIRRIQNYTIRLAFIVGRSSSESDQLKLVKENEINGDIIQRDFVESYRNMTRKHITLLEWVTKHCNHAEYLLKSDDDVFIDIFHVVREISEGGIVDGFLCSSTKNARPNRSQKGNLKKWYVTKEEYKDQKYPTYCEGYGYIVPVKYISKIFVCSMLNDFFWIDDVHVGGVLPNMLGIPRRDFSIGGGFFYMLPSHASHKILDGIFFVAYYSEIVRHQWRKMWQAAIDYSMTI